MRFPTLAIVFTVLLTVSHAWDTTSTTLTSPPTSTGSCPTVTQTGGSGCPAVTLNCTIEDCIMVSTLTQPCSCLAGLPTTTVCETTCHKGCQTTVSVLRIPCATTVTSTSSSKSSSSTSSSSCTDTSCSSSSSSTSSTCTTTSSTSSSSTCTEDSCTSSPTSSTTSTPIYQNSTVTVTSITTLSTCPYKDRCHGQTTIWTGTEGPFPCSQKPTCTCVLPGNNDVTITGPTTTTQVTTVGPTSTGTKTGSSPTSTGTGILQSSGGERRIADGWVGMVVAGLLGLL